jgi:hypothetical protein
VATGSIKNLRRRGTLRLRARRSLARGSYVLQMTGVDARGQRGTVAFRVRLR